MAKKTRIPAKPSKTPRDAAATRARILDKATGIFADAGYQGASVGDIVRAARVNKRMVYHYFGDKEGLYRAIFREQWGGLREWFERELTLRIEARAGGTVDAATLLTEAVDIASDFMASHQRFVRLMMWEGLEGGAISRSIWTDVRGPLYSQVEFLIRQAQESGGLDRALDPAHLVISFLGAIGFYFAYAPALGDMLHHDPMAPKALALRKLQLQSLMRSLLTSNIK
jgi:AcrR family transcriptional regulator